MTKVYNPELHPKALSLLDIVYRHHEAGQGAIPVSDLVCLFGITLDSAQMSMVGTRGDITLSANDELGGSFENSGIPAQFQQGMVRLRAPLEISGLYVSDPDHCLFRFNPSHTITGSAYLVLSSKLKGIFVDRRTIKIIMEDHQLDQVIRHKPDKATGPKY